MEDRTETFKLKSGAEYTISWDDKCLVIEKGITHLEPELLLLLMDYAWRNKIKDFDILLKGKV